MKSEFTILKLALTVICFAGSTLLVPGQDLGSTSGLFRSKTPSRPAAPAKKKSTPKKRNTKRRSSAKKSSNSTKRARPAAPKSTVKNTKSVNISKASSKTEKEGAGKSDGDIVITVGKPANDAFTEKFENAIAEGNVARDRRQYDQAEIAYRDARKLNPADSRALYGLGNVHSDQQRWEVAEEAYRQALKIDPGNPMASIALSYVLTQPVVGTNIGERYVEADALAQKAIKMDPDNALAYDQLGVAMELRGIIDETTENNYRKAISLQPTFALAFGHLGRLLRKQGRTAESSAAYDEAIRLAVSPPAMILVAEVMQSQQRFQDSEELLRKALALDERNPTGLYLLGRALTTRRSFDEAEDVLQKSLAVSPQSFVAYSLLASLYSETGNLLRAEMTLMQALKVISENEKKRLALDFERVGDGLMNQSRKSDAARLYRKAIELDGKRESLASKLQKADAEK